MLNSMMSQVCLLAKTYLIKVKHPENLLEVFLHKLVHSEPRQ